MRPLMVHLPGWFRHGLKVLDIVEQEGGDPAHTVLCHMNPSFDDPAYQTACAKRGAFVEYDMIGMTTSTPTSRSSAPPTRRRRALSAAWSTRATATSSCSRRTCSSR